ncbi:MAG: type II secretion system F family protein [Gemmatimonadaceae bacterium]
MPTFSYTARTAQGERRTATLEAATRDEAIAQLRRLRLAVVSLEEVAVRRTTGRVAMRDIVVFTRQFSTMINAGLPIVQALDILAKQTQNPVLQAVTRQVVFDVESGRTVAEALAKHPNAFSELYVNMVAAGEAGGILDTILLRLATFLEKNDALLRKVRSAMIYPAVILTIAIGAVAVLLVFVIPTFQGMFASVGAALPLPTRLVIAVSDFLQGFWWMVLGGIAALVVVGRRAYATPSGRRSIDRMLLAAPVVGDLLRKSAVSRFTRTLGTLISSGVSILDGLEITAKTAGNRVVADAILASRASIAGGDTIASPLARSRAFPPMVISMIAVGEQTGGLDEMLRKIADFYDDEVDTAVSGLLALVEPVMVVALGIVVGGMVVAMYLPIFDLISTVQ